MLRTPGVARLFVTANLGRLPLGFVSLAVVLLVRRATGSYTTAGIAVAAMFATMTVTAAPIGRLVDRAGQTAILMPTALVGATALGALATAGQMGAPTAALIALAALCGIMPPISSCQRAILSDHFTDPQRRSAFALESILQEIIWTVGPLIGTLALIVSGPPAMLYMAAVLILIGTALFAANPLSREWTAPQVQRGGRGALAQPGLRTLLLLSTLAALSFGQFEVAVPAFADAEGSQRSAGIILALWAVGSALGGLVYGSRISQAPPHRRLIATSLVCAVGFLPAAFAPNLWLLGPLALLAGLGIAPLLSVIYETTGNVAPDGMTTEAYSWLNVAFPAGFSLGAPLAGALADGPGARSALGTAGIAVAVGALVVHSRRGTLAPPSQVERGRGSGKGGTEPDVR